MGLFSRKSERLQQSALSAPCLEGRQEVWSGWQYFYGQEMIVCKFHLILRRAGFLAVTRGMQLGQVPREADGKMPPSMGNPQSKIRKKQHEGYLE
ncbi:hypothetical protein [Polaromonas sp.]|uniref:hypothetical protein n=1 Tax=Polaromonas sp. TaxID=1869339 RepID=UPI0025FB3B05|nr:hypothetical protein [Polaromonas sp.]